MATVTTLRPSSLSSGVGWTPSAGTLYAVTSDNNDSTYAAWGGSGSPLILGTPVDAPPVGERRHQVRMRARGEDGSAWWAVQTSGGAIIAAASAAFSASPGTVNGSWGFGAPADGSTVLYTYVTGETSGVKINELYIDVDTREAPTFTPQVLDGSGTSTTTVTDTTQPTIRANAIDLDGLNPRWYRYWVTLGGSIVWDTGVASGAAVNRMTSPLANGSYVAHLQIWTTLGANTENPSAEQTLAFTVSVGVIPTPDNPTVTPVEDSPFYLLEACAPDVTGLDGDVGYVEVQRVDCPVGGYLSLVGADGYASTPTAGAVTDLQITVTAQRDDSWFPAPGTFETIASHWNQTAGQRGWHLILPDDGMPELTWSSNGTLVAGTRANDRPPIDPYGVVRLRVLLDVNDGAGGWTVTFQAQEEEGGDWVQVGDVRNNSGGGTTAVFNTAAPYMVGAYMSGVNVVEEFTGRVYSLEVRSGAAGAVILNPDFTNHLDGTTEFEDAAGNEWTVHSPATLYAPASTVTVAMLGPLATGECAEWTDYTLPRVTAYSVCDHAPEPCCSYYRARTVGRVDGDLRISHWSDFFDDAVPAGMIVMWPGTNGSIPTGWARTTALDGRYPKGVPNSATTPGSTGGSATHTHTTPGHTHDTSHIHTSPTPTAAATGTVNTANTGGALKALGTHTHTRPSTDSATVVSGSSNPNADNENNDPARLEVIFIESDGSQTGVPNGALGMMADISPTGWTTYSNATNRFMKGAAAAGNGGATAVSSLDSHVHAIDVHGHPGTSHTHTSATTGSTASTLAPATGSNTVISAASHNHAITIGSASTATLATITGGNSGASGSLDPPYRNVRVRENTSGGLSLPVGLICAWRNPIDTIPESWQLCDGTNSTPNLLGVYPRGATASIGGTGGSLTGHNHTGGTHNHTTTGHSHTASTSASGAATTSAITTATVAISTNAHTHTLSDVNSTTPTVTAATAGTLSTVTQEPAYSEVAFVQLMEAIVPPEDPDLFCLEWDDDEHLIRTMSPDGPIWAPVYGKFDWDVERPFTAAVGVMGARFVTSAPPGGRNLHMTAAVQSEYELGLLRAVLARPLVLISPTDSEEVWAAPVAESVKIIKVGRVRQVTADFIGTGPQPPPQLADVA